MTYDAAQLASDNTLEVYRRSPVLRGVQAVPVAQVQEVLDALDASIPARELATATGYALETLGRIVGLYPRPFSDSGTLTYFAPDTPGAGADRAGLFVTGAPAFGLVPVSDTVYRAMIRAKIIKNHTRYGSAAECMHYGLTVYGFPISVRNLGLGDLQVTVPDGVSASVVAAIVAEASDSVADHQFSLPLPTTARIRKLKFKLPTPFAPDRVGRGADAGLVGVAYVVNP